MNVIKLSVIIPVYNESNIILLTTEAIYLFFQERLGDNFELIIVNDGSTDNSAILIRKFVTSKSNVVFLDEKVNMGKGYALKRGVEVSNGDMVFFTDVDLSTPINYYLALEEEFVSTNAEMVFGSRTSSNSVISVKQPIFRQLFGKIYYRIAYTLLGLNGVEDSNCGFKLYDGDIARSLYPKLLSNRWVFDVELIYLAKKSNHKINYVPVEWADDKTGSSVRLFSASLASLVELIKIRLAILTGKYEEN